MILQDDFLMYASLPTMFDVQSVSKNDRIHQSEIPVKLCEEILEYVTYEGELVLDSFAGSGAVGVAALNKRRSCILIEILKENIEKLSRGLIACYIKKYGRDKIEFTDG